MRVTFCGHSKIDPINDFSKWLDSILPSLIEDGAVTFYLGGYGYFDSLAAEAVKRQKIIYPHIESILVLPYLNKKFDVSDYDSSTYPLLEKTPSRYAIVKRNQWMVCESDVVISGVIYNWGGAAKTLEFAKRKKKVIFQYPKQLKKE